jgi:hypothetical protein
MARMTEEQKQEAERLRAEKKRQSALRKKVEKRQEAREAYGTDSPRAAIKLPAPKRRAAPLVRLSSRECKIDPTRGFCFDMGAANGAKLIPPRVVAPMVSDEAGFFANNLKDVCRVKKIAPVCYVPGTVDSEKPKTIRAWGKNTAFPNAKTESQKAAACKEANGEFAPGDVAPLRTGKTELDFLSKAQAKMIGESARAGGQTNIPARSGPNLRLCFEGSSKGVMIPVKSPAEAVAVRDTFRECLAQHGENPTVAESKACAIGLARKEIRGKERKQRRGSGGKTIDTDIEFVLPPLVGKNQMPALFGVSKRRSSRRRRRG